MMASPRRIGRQEAKGRRTDSLGAAECAKWLSGIDGRNYAVMNFILAEKADIST